MSYYERRQVERLKVKTLGVVAVVAIVAWVIVSIQPKVTPFEQCVLDTLTMGGGCSVESNGEVVRR